MHEMRDYTDEQIAVRVQKGSIQSFGELVARYEQKMIRYGRKFLFDSEEVRDLVNDSARIYPANSSWGNTYSCSCARDASS